MTQTAGTPGPRRGETAVVGGGRVVAFEEWGPRTGHPVFFLHGTPGSRLGVLPRPFELSLRKIRLIAIDRPGYGDSDRDEGRSVASVAADVEAVADQLGLAGFSVAGRSGGAPHALACGALLGERVRSVVALVSLAPFDAEGLDWFAGMTQSNVRAYRLARAVIDDPTRVRELKLSMVGDTGALAGDFIGEVLFEELPLPDRRVVSDARIRALLLEGFRHAARERQDNKVPVDAGDPSRTFLAGQFDDHLAFCRPWGFDPAQVTCPVLLWHGRADIYSPPSHSEWLAARIPHVVLDMDPVEAHFGAVKMFPHFLGWMRNAAARSAVG